VKITVKSPKTDPRIIIESEYGTAVLRPVDLWATEVLLINAFTKGKVTIDEHDL
jgi:hypothetical protein